MMLNRFLQDKIFPFVFATVFTLPNPLGYINNARNLQLPPLPAALSYQRIYPLRPDPPAFPDTSVQYQKVLTDCKALGGTYKQYRCDIPSPPQPQADTPQIAPEIRPIQPSGSCNDWMAQAGISDSQNAYILIMRESGCRVDAYNPSGAYGIPQALPGSKMAAAGADWQTNPVTQLRWMQGYVMSRYGSWSNALSHSYANNWY